MTITYRSTKGSALTYGEIDENFRDLLEDTDLQRVLTNGNTSNLGMTVANLNANVITSNNFTANVVYDYKGEVRSIPVKSNSTDYYLTADDAGQTISTTANVNVNGAVLSVGQAFSIYNNSASNISIKTGTGVTMYLAGTSTTGDRTLAQRGISTILMVESNTFVISGVGLT